MRQIAGPRVAELMRPAGTFRVKGITESVATALVRWREDDGEDAPPAREAAPRRPITVVIADDQRLLRTGFRVILDAEPDITVVGEAADGYARGRRRRAAGAPTWCSWTSACPSSTGSRRPSGSSPTPTNTTAVVMLTTFDASEYVFEALRIGATGFLLKDTPADRLLDAVRVAAAGEALHRAVASRAA